MTAAVNDPSRSVDFETRVLHRAQLLRAVALLISGVVVAFSAPLHSDLQFNRWVLFASLLAVGVTTAIEFGALRATPASWLVAARAAAAGIASVAVLFSESAADTAFVIAVWAASSVLIAVLRVTGGSQTRNVGVPSAVLSGALAVLVLLFRDDSVAIIGFFGAYAVVRGVFLGISAFDRRSPAEETAEETAEAAESGDDATAPARRTDTRPESAQ